MRNACSLARRCFFIRSSSNLIFLSFFFFSFHTRRSWGKSRVTRFSNQGRRKKIDWNPILNLTTIPSPRWTASRGKKETNLRSTSVANYIPSLTPSENSKDFSPPLTVGKITFFFFLFFLRRVYNG